MITVVLVMITVMVLGAVFVIEFSAVLLGIFCGILRSYGADNWARER